MTSKERVAAMVAGKPAELCYVPCIDAYTREGLPEKYRKLPLLELQAEFGSDMLRGPWCYQETFDSNVQRSEKTEGSERIRTFTTPVGQLRTVSTFTPQSPNIPFPVEHLVKTVEDLKVFRYMLEHMKSVPDFDDAVRAQKAFPNHAVASGIMYTPFEELLTVTIGIEQFVYMFFDAEDEIVQTMAVLQERRNEQVKITAQGPADIVIIYENTNTASSSPEWIEKYELPQLDQFADIIHAGGKKMLAHMCGKINTIVDKIAATKLDGLVDVAPAPTGDCNFPAAAAALKRGGKFFSGGIECNIFANPHTQKLRDNVTQLLDSMKSADNYMLGSGDAVPQGTSAENLMATLEIVKTRRK